MPYFHSAINVFKWLSLSSGFVIHSRNDSLKIEEEEKKKSGHEFISVSVQRRAVDWAEMWSQTTRVNSSSAQLNGEACIFPAPQWVAAVSGKP